MVSSNTTISFEKEKIIAVEGKLFLDDFSAFSVVLFIITVGIKLYKFTEETLFPFVHQTSSHTRGISWTNAPD